MRRIVLALVLITFAVPAFADISGAKVLPQGILRTTIVPVYAFRNDTFDSDFGFSTDSAADLKFFNTGIALEYGINDWITGAAQWAPGWTIWSDIDLDLDEDAELHRFFDLFAGAKIQVMGPNAPVRHTGMRFAVGAGFKIPLGYPDWDGQYDSDTFEALITGAAGDPAVTAGQPVPSLAGSDLDDPFILSSPDTNQLGVGLRLYYDYIFNQNWWINFYAEGGVSLLDGRAPGLIPHAIAELDGVEDKFDRRWDVEFEIEPHFETMLGETLELGLSLPVKLDYLPEIRLDGDKLSEWESDTLGGAKPFEDAKTTTGPFSTLSVGPTVRLFARGWTVPTEFIAKYTAPVAGRNSSVQHVFSLQIRNYLSF